MMNHYKWTRRWIDLALHVAQWSKDPSTKVGAVAVGKDRRSIAVGYNGFPRGIADTDERLGDRGVKYRLMQHAERNVLDNAAFDLGGATLVATKAPCSECAKSIVQKGIARVVCPPVAMDDRWFVEAGWGLKIMHEAKIVVESVSFDVLEVQWHLDNGGHRGRLAGHALRLLNEAVELCVAAGASMDEVNSRVRDELMKAVGKGNHLRPPSDEIPEEIADVQILLTILAHHAGHASTRPLVEKKLAVLRERKWEVNNDGVLWRPK